jgi:hypothetical protein
MKTRTWTSTDNASVSDRENDEQRVEKTLKRLQEQRLRRVAKVALEVLIDLMVCGCKTRAAWAAVLNEEEYDTAMRLEAALKCLQD